MRAAKGISLSYLHRFHFGYPFESASCSKRHDWFASRCPGRRLSTWPTTAVSCPTALGALCGQLTFRLAWCRQHSAVMATELLQPPDLACGTLFQSSCVIPTSPTDCSDDSWRDTFLKKHEHGALWLLICGAIEKHLLTHLPGPLWSNSWEEIRLAAVQTRSSTTADGPAQRSTLIKICN